MKGFKTMDTILKNTTMDEVMVKQAEKTAVKLVTDSSWWERFTTWVSKQAEVAKFAWTVVLLVAGLFGYKATLEPLPNQNQPPATAVMERLDYLEVLLKDVKDDLDKKQNVKSEVKVEDATPTPHSSTPATLHTLGK